MSTQTATNLVINLYPQTAEQAEETLREIHENITELGEDAQYQPVVYCKRGRALASIEIGEEEEEE